jgi:hypothetical protein
VPQPQADHHLAPPGQQQQRHGTQTEQHGGSSGAVRAQHGSDQDGPASGIGDQHSATAVVGGIGTTLSGLPLYTKAGGLGQVV